MSTRVVCELLEEYGGAARQRMMDYLPSGRPQRYLYDLMADYPRRGGRAMRPTLCMVVARAFGRPLEESLLTAVSIEMLHNAMLIHDDIEDESLERRGRPALHVQEGIPLALNAGDALALFGIRPLVDNRHVLGSGLSMRVLEEATHMTRESAEGQALELGWRRDNSMDVSEEDYLEMVLKKTCWLATIYPMRSGAIIGSRDRFAVDSLIRLGFLLGAAFQIQDDLLNLVGEAERYGKELGGDIYEGKRTLMLIRLMGHGDRDERARLHHILGLPRCSRTMQDVRWIRDAMDRYGCIEYARKFAHGLAGAARHECQRLFGGMPDSRERRFLEALPAWVIERK